MFVGPGGCLLALTTVIWAEAVPPFPASVEVTALVTLFCTPEPEPATFTAKVHEALAARLAPDRLTLFEPAAAVIVPAPQLPVNPLGVDTVSPDGKVSVKPMPFKEVAELGLDKLKVSVVVPFNATLVAPKAFVIVGGDMVGGGVPEPDEPPPQAAFQSKPKAIPRYKDTHRVFVQNVRTVFQFLFVSVTIFVDRFFVDHYFSWSPSGTSSPSTLGLIFICR
jgi:hypothetical protein